MADDQQRPAGAHSAGDRVVRLGEESQGRVEERRRHEVHAAGDRLAAEHVHPGPGGAVTDTDLRGMLGGPVDGHLRDINARGQPALLGEPDHVRTLSLIHI